MSTTIIKPTVVTPALLLSTTATEPTAEWAAGTTYAADARVSLADTRRVYQSVQAGNTGHDPRTAPTWWVDVGATNPWAMFDGGLGTLTQSTTAVTVVLRPGMVSAIALLQVRAAFVRVVMRSTSGGVTVYDKTEAMNRAFVTNWWEYFTAPFEYRNEVIFMGLPAYPDCELEVTITSDNVVPAQCGEMVLGSAFTLGDPQQGARLGLVDYSRKDTDEWGNTTLTQRAFARTLDLPLLLDAEQLSKVYGLLSSLRATPIVVIPSAMSRFSAMVVYGWIGDFSIELQSYSKYYCNLQVKGLT